MKIETGIPLPPKRNNYGGQKQVALRMNLLDSVLVDSWNQSRSLGAAMYRLGYAYTAQKQIDGKIRVWRVG